MANNSTKLATFMVLTGLELPAAEVALLQHKGFLRKAIEQSEQFRRIVQKNNSEK
jgi:N-acetylmuramic acid 6-phosphate (MurNAc-6-P) etherase